MKYKLFLAIIFFCFAIFSFVFFANQAFAYGTITNYSRTPNTDIEQGNTYTIEYDISYPSLTVAGETFSAIVTYSQSSSGLNNFYHCTTAGPTSTHVSFTTAALTEIEDYTRIKAELNYDDAYCTDPGTFPGIGVNVEYNSGAVIFSVIPVPVIEVNTKKFIGSIFISFYLAFVIMIIINNVSRIFSRPR